MKGAQGIHWTNKSVLRLAGEQDPIEVIERRSRELTLKARDAGWSGPPFDPIAIADLLKIPVEANASVPDARIFLKGGRLTIQYNPTQARARVRFSIAHEIAHTLFPDVADEVRHRGGNRSTPDDWQLEALCNIAAAEFVMPLGSMPPSERLPAIETLMLDRKRFEVSVEAYLIRATKITSEPVVMFCASALQTKEHEELPPYRIDYTVLSRTAPQLSLRGKIVPKNSAVHACTAIGYTDRKVEDWFAHKAVRLECVGIPSYFGSTAPRVGLTSHAKVARGVEPRACAFATKTGVVMTDQSVVTVSAFLFRFCGLIGRAFLRTIRLDPFGWDHNEFDLDRSIRIVRSNPELLLYWFKIYFSFATTGTHVLVPFEPATPSEIAAFEDIAWAMEYFAVAHEYGHHHHSHGKDLSSDAHREEFEADQFALRIGTKLARYQRRIENPYVASGAGGIIILWALHTLKSFPAAGSSVSNGKLDTHPNLKERLGRFESVAVLQPSEFERLRRFRMAALRLMSVIHGQMCEAMDAVPSDLLKNLSCASQWT